jgi:Bacterial self-protective colicin-like immunity
VEPIETDSVSTAIATYRRLVERLVRDEITPAEFERPYFDAWAANPYLSSDRVFEIVNAFFQIVEDYCDDPRLRDPAEGDLGPDELFAGARDLLARAERNDW